jgi:serpin B
MLLVAFEKPQRVPSQSKQKLRAYRHLSSDQRPTEGAWITNTLLYRGKGTMSAEFITNAQKYYGVNFISTGEARPTAADLKSSGHSGRALSMISGEDDVLISSGSHLQTAWSGNTFSVSAPHKAGFRTASGELRQVEMLDSELGSYLYAKTDKFEAVALPCNNAYMVAALPAPGQSVHDLERLLAETPDAIDTALKQQIGTIAMPTFHFQFEANLRQQIEQMGVRKVFEDLGPIVKIPKSHLTQVSQKTDIQVDKEGIRASAETVAGAVYGGIMGAQNAFHMELNRPFIFLIRDRTTNALLFLGAVVDPTQP